MELSSPATRLPLQPRRFSDSMPDTPVTSLEAMTAIVQAEGDLELASARLHTKPANILAALVQDAQNHDLLTMYLRVFSTLKLFTLVADLQLHLNDQIENLGPRDLARTYVDSMKTLTELTAKAANNITTLSPMDAAMRMFPPDVRKAVSLIYESSKEANNPISNVMIGEVAS